MFNRLTSACVFLLCGLAFADISDSTDSNVDAVKDSVVKKTLLLNLGYVSGLEISAVPEADKAFEHNGNNYTFRYGPGFGVVYWEKDLFLPIFFNAHLGLNKALPQGDFEFFINNRLGTHIYASYYMVNDNYADEGRFESCFLLCDIFYEPSIGVQYRNFSFSLGYYFSSDFENSFVLRAGYRHDYEMKIKDETQIKNDSADVPKEKEKEKKSSRWFRLGIEANYPIWRSEIEFFDNAYTLGAGLFLRIGSEFFYFTSGAYVKIESLQKEGAVSADMNAFGLTIATLPLLDIKWNRGFFEIPLLINFGSGQIRFTGGALLEMFAGSDFDDLELSINYEVPVIGGRSLRDFSEAADDALNEQFDKSPYGNLYWVLGLDFDIVRYWGIGVKYMIWGGSWGTSNDISDALEKIYEPAHSQIRVSTYFVF